MFTTNNSKNRFQYLLFEVNEGIGFIKINRPEQRNALNWETLLELEEAINLCEQLSEVKVIVITGEGKKSFAAGADIKQLQERSILEALLPGMQATYKRIENCSKGTIAVINGYALGGGCELALACDIRIAADHSLMGLPELNLSIIPAAGGTQRLGRIIGKGRAMDMILTGKLVGGKEAEVIGLVSRSVPYEQLWDAVKETTSQIMKKGPVAVQLAKMVVHRGFDVDLDTAMMLEKMAQSIAFGTDDKNEGIQAFLEKRTPNFLNR
ncbi:enoyl-CoA hydratase/isomerase family protein [Halalkalibacter flavus]|uniref:enoyl-CoA hydratase/isomerase family protein n=1 Tax=Halalkalibacter flavus TaxID=3090668 RepID=UPI002FC726B5